jgi:hypothetical protein
VAKQTDNLNDPSRPARMRSNNRRQTVGERSSLTLLMRASPAAQQELHCHGLALDWQILEAPAGPAMPTSASTATLGADADRGSGCGNNPTVVNGERNTQNLHPWAGRPFRFPVHARP